MKEGVPGDILWFSLGTKIAVREHRIVPEEEYDRFLAGVTDPHKANHSDTVVDLPRTLLVQMAAVDYAYSLNMMANGAHGTCHDAPAIRCCRRWRTTGGITSVRAGPSLRTSGPSQPRAGSNYYHESSRHRIECTPQDREPIVNVDWGLHITEMMAGAVKSAKSGQRYEMTTTINN